MSQTYEILSQHLKMESESKRLEGSAFKWAPFKISSRGSKDVSDESVQILEAYAQIVVKTVTPVIDPETHQPIQESTRPRDAKKFCELDRIIKSKEYTKDAKVELISVPTLDSAMQFLVDYFKYAKVTREVAVFSFVLIERLLNATSWKLKSTNWRLLVLLAIRLAQKIEGQKVVSADVLAALYPIFTPQEFIKLEISFLKLIDYNCYIDLEAFTASLKTFVDAAEN